MIKNTFLNYLVRITRLILPAVALVLGFLDNAYRLTVVDEQEIARWVYTNYFDTRIVESSDFGPMACMLLCIVAIVCAFVCIFKETERTLTTLAGCCSFAMIGALLPLIIHQHLTVIGWTIAGILLVNLIITAIQEMKLEDANRGR